MPFLKVNCSPTLFFSSPFSSSGDIKENFRGKCQRVSAQEVTVTISLKSTEKVEVCGYTEIIAGIMHRQCFLFCMLKFPEVMQSKIERH